MKVWMQEMTWAEVEQRLKETDIVILPVGSTEQHGPHLPLGVDTMIPIHLAEQVAERTGVPVAPPVWFAACEWHMGFPGTISVRPVTVINLLADIARSLHRHGFNHIIAINGHTSGHNPAILSMADEIQVELPDLRVWDADVYEIAKETVQRVCEAEIIYHGDELEASQMIVARGDLVDLEKAKKIVPSAWSQFARLDYRPADQVLFRPTASDWRELTDQGQIGDPTLASHDKGEAIMAASVENLTTFIEDLQKRKADRS